MLHDLIGDASSQYYSFILKTNLLCKYNKILNLVQGIACDCTSSGQNNCFDGKLIFLLLLKIYLL